MVYGEIVSQSACFTCLQVAWLHSGSFTVRAVGQAQPIPCRGRAGWAVRGLGTGGIGAGGVERLFHLALPAELPGTGHLVSERALPTSQEAMEIKEVG